MTAATMFISQETIDFVSQKWLMILAAFRRCEHCMMSTDHTKTESGWRCNNCGSVNQ